MTVVNILRDIPRKRSRRRFTPILIWKIRIVMDTGKICASLTSRNPHNDPGRGSFGKLDILVGIQLRATLIDSEPTSRLSVADDGR